MTSILRSVTFGFAAVLAITSLSQSFHWAVDGSISGCYPGQTMQITITADGNVVLQADEPVDPGTCTFGGVYPVFATSAQLTVSTQCNGMMFSLADTATFNFLQDTAFTTVSFVCGSSDPVDCYGLVNGPDMPGTPCVPYPGANITGVWTPDCYCDTLSVNTWDCEGELNGPAMPGTPCLYTPDSGSTWLTGIWSVDCVCAADTALDVDCEGTPGGEVGPGDPCIVPGTILEGTWNSTCECIPNNTDPCEADFWVIQAMGPDSLPVPYELWVWNLSSGGSGNFAFIWDFGDGSTSSQPFPSHTYSGNGPYNLCLTITDSNGCTDTHCDSISINGDGIYEGMPVHDLEDRQDGFTLNVQNANANAVNEVVSSGSIAMWPNPAAEELNVAVVGTMQGSVLVTITDLDGRTVKTERMSLSGGRSQLRIATVGLNAGMYMLRLSDGITNLSQRFVKAD